MKTVKITLVVTLLLMYTCFGANAAEIRYNIFRTFEIE